MNRVCTLLNRDYCVLVKKTVIIDKIGIKGCAPLLVLIDARLHGHLLHTYYRIFGFHHLPRQKNGVRIRSESV